MRGDQLTRTRTRRSAWSRLVPLGLLVLSVAAGAAHGKALESVRLGSGMRYWKMKADSTETRLWEMSLPVSAGLRVASRTQLAFAIDAASATYELAGGGKKDLSGVSDLRVRIIQEMVPGRVFVMAGLNVPTGKASLSGDETAVVRALGHPVLGMPLREFGRGAGMSLALSLSLPLEGWLSAGLGASYLRRGEYSLISGADKFRPTPEGALSVGLEAQGGGGEHTPRKLNVILSSRFLGKNRQGETDVLKEGREVEVSVSGEFPADPLGFFARSQVLWKGENTIYAPEGSELEPIQETPGTGLFLRIGVQRRLSTRLDAQVVGDWTHFSKSEELAKNGNAYGLGPALSLRGVPGFVARLQYQILTGTLDGVDSETALSGHALALSFARIF